MKEGKLKLSSLKHFDEQNLSVLISKHGIWNKKLTFCSNNIWLLLGSPSKCITGLTGLGHTLLRWNIDLNINTSQLETCQLIIFTPSFINNCQITGFIHLYIIPVEIDLWLLDQIEANNNCKLVSYTNNADISR